MWSHEVKQGLIEHLPQVALNDSFGASEAVGFGMSVTTADGVVETAKFEIGEHCKVFAEDGTEIQPGSDQPGLIGAAVGAHSLTVPASRAPSPQSATEIKQ